MHDCARAPRSWEARPQAGLVTASPNWDIIEFRGRAGLLELEADWRRLYAAMPMRNSQHIFESHLAYLDHVARRPDEIRCLALRERGEVRAICLLQPRTDRILGPPVQVWQLPDVPLMRLRDIICPEDDARRAFIPLLVDYLRERPDGCRLVDLGPLPENSVLWEGLERVGAGMYCTEKVEGMHVVDCTKPYEEFVARLSGHFRADLRRLRRKLDRLADVQFVTVTDATHLDAAYDTLLDLESSGWKGAAAGSSIQSMRGWPAFFRSLLSISSDGDRCEIHALYADGRCIASLLGVLTGGEYDSLKTCYDEDYSPMGPSLQLLAYAVERCCQDPQVVCMNWLNEWDWQLRWRPDSVAMQHTYIAIGRWSAVPLVALLRLRFGYVRRLRRWLRRERGRLESWRAGRRAAESAGSSR